MTAKKTRRAWVSYLRVSTTEQAERDLSLPAQKDAVETFAKRHNATIAREYIEPSASGMSPHRPAFRRMLEDVFSSSSDVGTIVVHHTSRFTRDATEARIVKTKLGKAGVSVLSVCQDLHKDPMGKLMEGVFECIDQYESEINGVRTAAAMREAVKQGFFPGAIAPYGFLATPVEIRPGIVRRRLVPHESEAAIVREIFRLYVCENGAKAVARSLNQRGVRYRTGVFWNRQLVLNVLDQAAVAGTYKWGRDKHRPTLRNTRTESLDFRVERIVDPDLLSSPSVYVVNEIQRSTAAVELRLSTCFPVLFVAASAAPPTSLKRQASASTTASTDIATTTAAQLAAWAKNNAAASASRRSI